MRNKKSCTADVLNTWAPVPSHSASFSDDSRQVCKGVPWNVPAQNKYTDLSVQGSRKENSSQSETQSPNSFQKARAPPRTIDSLFFRGIWSQWNTAVFECKTAAQASVLEKGNLGWESQPMTIGDGLSSSLWEKQRKTDSKVRPRPAKWIYNCAAPFLFLKSPAIPSCIPNMLILKVPKRNWDLAYLWCCKRQHCRRPVYNIPCISWPKAGLGKQMDGTANLCSHRCHLAFTSTQGEMLFLQINICN